MLQHLTAIPGRAQTGSIQKVFGQRCTKCRGILAGRQKNIPGRGKTECKAQLKRGDFGVIITSNKEKE